MDEVDFKLLCALHEDALLSYRALAARVHLTAPAVRDRLQRLERQGVLQGFWAWVHPGLFGLREALYHLEGEWTREEALRLLRIPSTAWVAHKTDGALTVLCWEGPGRGGARTLLQALGESPALLSRGTPASFDVPARSALRILDAVLQRPRHRPADLSEITRLTPKTSVRLRDQLRERGILEVLPLLGTLSGSGDLVFHLAVFGPAPPEGLARMARDAKVVNSSEDPPVRYLLCRASDLASALAAVARIRKSAGVEQVHLTLNREMLVNTPMMRTRVARLIAR